MARQWSRLEIGLALCYGRLIAFPEMGLGDGHCLFSGFGVGRKH
jgi:hypothetical protein